MSAAPERTIGSSAAPSRILAALARHAAATPDAIAIEGADRRLDYASLLAEVEAFAAALRAARPGIVGLLAENGADWAIADLACLAADIPLLPLPGFFSSAQLAHALGEAGVGLLLSDRAPASCGIAATPSRLAGPGRLGAFTLKAGAARLPDGTAKITFTSGSTGTPKGVCLSRAGIEEVAAALHEASAARASDRHLSVLPLATLLENIGGLYVPLLAGATTRLLPGECVGLQGSSGLAPQRLLAALAESRATSAILVPQLLLALVATLRGGAAPLPALRYLAVGGAPLSPRLLAAAADLGLPAFEGYGLSECASVVAVNRRGEAAPGSVGRPLPHLTVRIATDGTIQVRGSGFLGYLGDAAAPPVWLDTGDLGHFDEDGRLHVSGRRKNLFITAFGRNVAPEWVERELLLQPAIAQAALFGEGRAFNVAVIVARDGAGEAAIAAAIARANQDLPDYARVAAWVRAETPFGYANGQLTANGRPRREAIAQAWAEAIERCYTPSNGKIDMDCFTELEAATALERARLLAAPIVVEAFAGRVTRAQYVAFLSQAYHHVRHTVPLLMACGARLPARLEWLREAVAHYIAEEFGHQEWILADIAAAGGAAEAVRDSQPAFATELMVAYAYDGIQRGNPVGFFGMVYVLESTSVALASRLAAALGPTLDLPRTAFSYLSSHGSLDVSHMADFRALVNRLEEPADRRTVIDAAGRFFQLYGDVIRSLPTGVAA